MDHVIQDSGLIVPCIKNMYGVDSIPPLTMSQGVYSKLLINERFHKTQGSNQRIFITISP